MMLDLLDKDLGARIRGALVVLIGVATFLIFVLQAALDAAHSLPDWEAVGAVGVQVQALITLLGRFTAVGNKVLD